MDPLASLPCTANALDATRQGLPPASTGRPRSRSSIEPHRQHVTCPSALGRHPRSTGSAAGAVIGGGAEVDGGVV